MTFPDKQKSKEFSTSRHVLQEIKNGVLQAEMKGHQTETHMYMKLKVTA